MHTRLFKISDYEYGKNRMIEYFEHILQSDEKFTGYTTRIDITIFDRKEGGSRNKAYSQDDIKAKKGIITINNSDDLCMIRAIAVGNAINNNHPKLRSIKDSRKNAQLIEALDIIKNCDLSEDGPFCIDDINKIAPYIKSNIYIVDRQGLNKAIYKTDLPYNNKIYLLHDNQHYNLITSMTAHLGASYY